MHRTFIAFTLAFALFCWLATTSFAASTKDPSTTSPGPGELVTFTNQVNETTDQFDGRPIHFINFADEILAPYTFVSAACSLSCSLTTPVVGASGTVTVTGFGQTEGPHDPAIIGTITIVIQAPVGLDQSFTNQACLTVFVGPTMSYPQFCVSAPTVMTVPPTATPTPTETPIPTETPTVTATSSATETVTVTVTFDPTETGTIEPSVVPSEMDVSPTETTIPDQTVAAEQTLAAQTAQAAVTSTPNGDVTGLPNTGVAAKNSDGGARVAILGLVSAIMILIVALGCAIRRRDLTT